MASILKKITIAAQNRTTYRVGLLQAKTYRILNQKTAAVLLPYSISPIEWAFLGLLYDEKQMRPKDAAEELGVEAPFITATFRVLERKGLVKESADSRDSRAKVISLSQKGKKFVKDMEPIVFKEMKEVLKDIKLNSILGYLAVLEGIANNSKKK